MLRSLSPSKPIKLAHVGERGAGGEPRTAPLHRVPPDALADDVAVLLLADMAPGSRLWGWSRIVRGPGALGRVPGLGLTKVLGSGHEGGFGLKPSASRQGLFTVFEDEASADRFIERSDVVRAYRKHARELCTVKLRAYSSRGQWAGASRPVTAQAPLQGPIAVLTRASIRAMKAFSFWRMAPAAQASLETAPGCTLAVGLGEAPLLRQATFSIWQSTQAMENYARQGAHLAAIRQTQAGGHFSESMFVRFVPLAIQGDWKGQHFG